jgi:hypothetical protein
MNLQVKPTLVIIGTLLIGIVLGALMSGTLAERRHRKIRSMMRPDGFSEQLIEVIQPQDSDQRDAIAAVLQNTGRRIDEMMQESRADIHATVDSMALELKPLLTDEQNARLQKHLGDRRARPEKPERRFPHRPGP